MERMVSNGSDIDMCFDNFGFPINSITVWILIFTDSRFATNTNADIGECRVCFPADMGIARMVCKGSDFDTCFDNFGFPMNSIKVWILIFTDSRFATNTNADFGEWRIYFPADIGDGADGMVSFWNAIITVSQF